MNRQNQQENPEVILKKRRAIWLQLVGALVIQVIVLLAYYFKEKQVVLSVPMVAGIFLNIVGLTNLSWLMKHR